jgi:hypothetical protein
MVDLREKILKAYAGTERLRRDLLNNATREYFETLGSDSCPADSDFDVAQARVRSLLKKELLSSTWLSAIDDGALSDEHSIAAMALTFDSISSPLRIPKPAKHIEPKAFSIALSALAGAVIGIILLTPLARLAFDMRDLGLVLGGPLGAFCMVLIAHRLSRSRLLMKLMRPVFGIKDYQPGYERQGHEEVVRMFIEQWLNLEIPLLAALYFYRSWSTQTRADKEIAFRRIGGLIYTLHRTSSESLPVVADELIQEAKNCGFEGLDGSSAFLLTDASVQNVTVWTNNLQNKYETFGQIDEGDQVKIERQPVIFAGMVIERGLVRKLRDKT